MAIALDVSFHAGRWADTFIDSNGRLLKATSFEVLNSDGTTTATTYADRNKTEVAVAHVTDVYGMGEFYAEPGTYYVRRGTYLRKVVVYDDPDDSFDGEYAETLEQVVTTVNGLSASAVLIAGDQTIAGVKTFSGTLNIGASSVLNVAGTLSAHKTVYVPRITVRNDEGDGSQQGIMVTNVGTDGFDMSKRLGLFHYVGARATAGSLLLVNVEKDDGAAVTTIGLEGQGATVQGGNATASHLRGVQGIALHRSNATLPEGVGLTSVIQVDCGDGNPTPGTITSAVGLYVDRPQTFGTGAITTYRGIYIAGKSDNGTDSAGDPLQPANWYGLEINMPHGTSFNRAMSINGRSSLYGEAVGDIVLDASVQGDAATRWRMDDKGVQFWGDGTNAVDCTLQRRAAKVMEWASTVMRLGQFATASKPGPATAGSGAVIWVSDPATAGQNLQVSDGSVWKYIPLSSLT